METVKSKINALIQVTYGLADFGFIFMVNLTNMYLLLFFTEVVKISPVTAGIIMTSGRILDTISVPIVGPIIEKSNLPWGRYRSWLLIGPVLVLVFNTLLFVNWSNVSTTMTIIFGTLVYAAFCISTNVAYIGYTSLNSSLTTDPKEKVQLSTRRGQGNSLGKIAAGYILLPLIYFFSQSNEVMAQKGFFIVAIITGVVLVLAYLILFYTTRDFKDEGVVYDQEGKAKKSSTKDLMKQVISSRPLLTLLIADICKVLSMLLLFSVFPYFFIYVVQDPAKIPVFFGNINLLALFGSLLIPFITKKLTKRNTYRSGMLLLALSMILIYFVRGNANLVIVLASIGYIGYSWGNIVNTAMYADITEYGEWKTGINARAVNFSVFQLSIKIAAVLSTSISAFGLAAIGFQSGVAPTPEVVQGITNIAVLLPVCFIVISMIALTLYNVDEKKLPQMRKELDEKKTAAQA